MVRHSLRERERERVKTTYIIVQSKIYEELYDSEEFKCD